MAAASAPELGKLVAEHVRGAAFEPARELGDRHVWRMGDQEVDVVAFAGELGQLAVERVEHRSGPSCSRAKIGAVSALRRYLTQNTRCGCGRWTQ